MSTARFAALAFSSVGWWRSHSKLSQYSTPLGLLPALLPLGLGLGSPQTDYGIWTTYLPMPKEDPAIHLMYHAISLCQLNTFVDL
jgi:hypothetical protein